MPQNHRYGQLVEDTKTILRSFTKWECHHVCCQSNGAAHGIKKTTSILLSIPTGDHQKIKERMKKNKKEAKSKGHAIRNWKE
jgi:hypothetical protein